MKYFLLVFAFLFLQDTAILGQCAEISFSNLMYSKERPYLALKKKAKQNDGSIEIYGGYIHATDSIKIYKDHHAVYSNRILNEQPEVDGKSFATSVPFGEDEKRVIKVELDTCHYLIDIPGNAVKVNILRMRPDLSVIFYLL